MPPPLQYMRVQDIYTRLAKSTTATSTTTTSTTAITIHKVTIHLYKIGQVHHRAPQPTFLHKHTVCQLAKRLSKILIIIKPHISDISESHIEVSNLYDLTDVIHMNHNHAKSQDIGFSMRMLFLTFSGDSWQYVFY